MDLAHVMRDVKNIAQALEKISKRLRRVEVLSRLAQVEQIDTFLDLTDTPDSYAGMYGWVPTINNLETGLEFLPVGGGACVAFICGAVGWRAVGGTDPRTLVHEEAFQLDADGDARGAYAIDLQQDRNNVDEVAAGQHSAILGGDDNKIHPGSTYCVALGGGNEFNSAGGNEPWGCYQIGDSNTNEDDSYQVFSFGVALQVEKSDYCFLSGYDHLIEEGFGIFVSGIANTFAINGAANASPVYCATIGLDNNQVGDCWFTCQFGEDNWAEGGGVLDTVIYCAQFGHDNYIGLGMQNNYQFGEACDSYTPTNTGYYDGRMMYADGRNKVSGNTPSGNGFNQDSFFFQNDLITTWAVAWTTSRFEFPIIEDSLWYFEIRITCIELGAAASHAWKIEGVVENDGGTTTILTQTVTNIYRDVATKEWQAAADDPNDRLIFQFRDTGGPDVVDTNVQMSMHTVEVGFEF